MKQKMKQRVAASFLIAVILLGLHPFSAMAKNDALDDVEVSVGETQEESADVQSIVPLALVANGQCGDSVFWSFDDTGLLTISGTGKMYDYTMDTMPWYAYAQQITNIVIEQGVTHAGNYMAYGFRNLENLTLPEGLLSIGNGAFGDGMGAVPGNKLSELVLPDSLQTIGEIAFQNCKYIQTLRIPPAVESIGRRAFRSNTRLREIDFSAAQALTSIGESSFNLARSLQKLDFSGATSLITIERDAFGSNYKLAEVIFSNSLENIGNQAFAADAVGLLTKVEFPASIQTMGSDVFQNQNYLQILIFRQMQAPQLAAGTFSGVGQSGTLYFSKDATGFEKGVFGEPYLNNWNFYSIPAVIIQGSAKRLGETSAFATFTGDERSEYYYQLMPYGAPAPTMDTEVKGHFFAQDAEQTILLDNLNPGQDAQLYVVAKSDSGDLSNTLVFDLMAPKYSLTVVNGTGSGTYTGGAKVTLEAAPELKGKVFSHWESTTGEIVMEDEASAKTTFTMPFYNGARISALYVVKTQDNPLERSIQNQKPSADSGTTGGGTTETRKSASVKTGDNSALMLWSTAALLAVGMVVVAIVVREKRREQGTK